MYDSEDTDSGDHNINCAILVFNLYSLKTRKLFVTAVSLDIFE